MKHKQVFFFNDDLIMRLIPSFNFPAVVQIHFKPQECHAPPPSADLLRLLKQSSLYSPLGVCPFLRLKVILVT